MQSMEFSRPEYWSGQPFPSPGDLPNPGIKPRSPTLRADSLPAEPQGKPKNTGVGSLSLLQLPLEAPLKYRHVQHMGYRKGDDKIPLSNVRKGFSRKVMLKPTLPNCLGVGQMKPVIEAFQRGNTVYRLGGVCDSMVWWESTKNSAWLEHLAGVGNFRDTHAFHLTVLERMLSLRVFCSSQQAALWVQSRRAWELWESRWWWEDGQVENGDSYNQIPANSETAVIVPATCYFAQNLWMRWSIIAVRTFTRMLKSGSQRGPTLLSLATERQLMTCRHSQAMVWEIPHGNFLTCHNLPHLLIHHLLWFQETFTILS